MTSVDAALVIALVVSASLVAMWAVLYRGMQAERDVCCAARERRELAEWLAASAGAPAGTLAKVGPQRTARQDADVVG